MNIQVDYHAKGWNAYVAGRPISDSPFTNDTTDSRLWRLGWFDARDRYGQEDYEAATDAANGASKLLGWHEYIAVRVEVPDND